MDKQKTACFTGHRPEKIPGYGKDNNILYVIKSMLNYRIYNAVQSGVKYFISGLARGVDLWAAESVIEIRKTIPDIKLIGAKPFPEHGSTFKSDDLWCLNNVIECADSVICVSDGYFSGCYKKRNRFMVDNSSCLIGVVSDYKSGTGQTIAYARQNGLELSIINISDVMAATHKINTNYQFSFD